MDVAYMCGNSELPKFLSLSEDPGIGQLHCWQEYFLLYFVKIKIVCLD